MLSKAIAIAAQWFENKYDKWWHPYILHCIRVMMNLWDVDDELKTIAILHDCIEDGICTFNDLQFCSPRVLEALDLLTHRKWISYEEYIETLSYNTDAKLVKMADLKDNSDINRLKWITDKDIQRMIKYHKAYLYLNTF